MYRKNTHRFSILILPLVYLIDSILIYLFVVHFNIENMALTTSIFVVSWFFISYFSDFYAISRNTRLAQLIAKTIKQVSIFDLFVISYFHFLELQFPNRWLVKNLLLINLSFFLAKFLVYVLLKLYRSKGGNLRKYVIIGVNSETEKFKDILEERKDYGYTFDQYFGKSNTSIKTYGDIDSLFPYLEENTIDVIFCSLKECSDSQIKEIVNFADDRFIDVKFIPDNKEILGKHLKVDYFEYFPILAMRKSPLDKPVNKILKRSFDIVFSALVIVGILSWLMPIIGLIIKWESKGPILFKQLRNGINYEPFNCYKFRSMRPNNLADLKQVSKGDNRITKVGGILRKTSLDELPQFFNVFLGDMSVVGPRPHMIKENERFLQRVDKFMTRHYVKPGITGMAQVKGYRGEVRTGEDIQNRLKYDLFYIENWSFWLDIKIILYTVLDVIRGDEKAY